MAETEVTTAANRADAAPMHAIRIADALPAGSYPGCSPALLTNMERIARASRGLGAISALLRTNLEAATGSDADAPPPIDALTTEGLLYAAEALADLAYETAAETAAETAQAASDKAAC